MILESSKLWGYCAAEIRALSLSSIGVTVDREPVENAVRGSADEKGQNMNLQGRQHGFESGGAQKH